jgi:hypothetical protein
MKIQAKQAMTAREIKAITLPDSVFRAIGKTVATTKFETQFVHVAREAADPITCKG